MEEKRFDEWNGRKKKMHMSAHMPRISEGEVYWCGFGENVGVEINGKNKLFSRPVLIYKKLSREGFLGIPLSTQLHDGSWYVSFRFQEKQQVAVLSQVRVFSVFRLYGKIGQLDDTDMERIRQGFYELYCK